jgi:glutamate/tyrosine decarboxylase-like PLP-dependent enzyme
MPFPASLDRLIATLLAAHRSWEAQWPSFAVDESLGCEGDANSDSLALALDELLRRLRNNYPHFHPLYAGQMLKPPHPAAVLGYLAAMLINPNNHALDGGRATAAMEKEAIAELARMIGYAGDHFLGHLTASGTVANLEALWIARELHPELPIAFGADAHYTHKRMCALLRTPCVELPATPRGHIDLEALDALLDQGPIGTLVVTLGTTGLGAIDPLPAILARRARHGFRIHADMAYGGYYRLLAASMPALGAFARTAEVDSIVIDPHKHGLQPYGCGCVLFADASVARHYAHSSPYTYFSSPAHHPGETTLECSRAGAAAAALWLTLKCLPLSPPLSPALPAAATEGHSRGLAAGLAKCLAAARAFASALRESEQFELYTDPELDIVTYYPRAASLSAISAASNTLFEETEAAGGPYLAKLAIDAPRFAALHPDVGIDASEVTILRSCLMRPEQAQWAPVLAGRLAAAAARQR